MGIHISMALQTLQAYPYLAPQEQVLQRPHMRAHTHSAHTYIHKHILPIPGISHPQPRRAGKDCPECREAAAKYMIEQTIFNIQFLSSNYRGRDHLREVKLAFGGLLGKGKALRLSQGE